MYVDWPSAVIHVSTSDMVLVEPAPPAIKPIYQLDTDWFRLQLKDLEDDVQGMAWPDTHQHNTTVEVSGAILARVIEIINGYVVEFDDGQYAVNLVGSNNNIADVTVVNQVSIRPSNSAGLQDLNSLQAASFLGYVALKPSSPFSGTVFPTGTRGFPVNNVADAILIAVARGIQNISIMESMTLNSGGDWPDGINFVGDNAAAVHLIVHTNAEVSNCEFRNLTLGGILDGNNVVRDCNVLDLDYVEGIIHQCALNGTITLVPGAQASIFDSYSNVAGGGPDQWAHIDMGVSASLVLRNYSGGLSITNWAGSGSVSLDFLSGRLNIEDTITSGDIYVRGICNVIDGSGPGATVWDQTISQDIGLIRDDIGAVDSRLTAIEGDMSIIQLDIGFIRAENTLTHKILRNKKVTFKSGPSAGKMIIYDDDGTTPLMVAQIYEDDQALIPYRGTGIERQERLD